MAKIPFITLAGSTRSTLDVRAGARLRAQHESLVALQERIAGTWKRASPRSSTTREVGTGYFDQITQVVTAGKASTTALHGSTEDEQFFDAKMKAKKVA